MARHDSNGGHKDFMPAVGTEDLARYIIEPSKRGAPRGPGRDGSPPPIPKEIVVCLLPLNSNRRVPFLQFFAWKELILAWFVFLFFSCFFHLIIFFFRPQICFLHHVQPGASATKNVERLQVAKLVFFQEAMRESRFTFAGLSLLDTFQSSMAFVHSLWWEAP